MAALSVVRARLGKKTEAVLAAAPRFRRWCGVRSSRLRRRRRGRIWRG